jgi:hypothetical protein
MDGREAFAKRLAVGGTASAGTVKSWQKLVEKDAMADARIITIRPLNNDGWVLR